MHSYVERTFRDTVTAHIAPPIRKIASLVRESERTFDGVVAGLKELDELRAVAQAAEMDGHVLDTILADVIREIVGADTLVSPVTGGTSIGDFATLLYDLAAAQQQTKTAV